MALDVSTITGYVDENKNELIAATVAGATSAQLLNLQTGYKSSGTINVLDTDVVLQADSCGRTPSGTTSVTQRILSVGEIKVEEDLCVKVLNKTYLQHAVKAGSKDDVLPFEADYTSLKAEKIANAMETAIWQGDTGSGTVNLKRFDGFLKIIDAEGSVIDGNTGALTAITSTNIEAAVDGVYDAIPAELLSKDDTAIFMGHDTFRLYSRAVRNANYFHIAPEAGITSMNVAGTNVKIYAVEGLNGTSRIIAGRTSGFIVGVDLENEEETFDMWYSMDDKVVKFDAAFKMGVQVAFPSEIVEFTLA